MERNFLFGDGSVHYIRSITSDAGVNPDGSTRYTPSSLIFQKLGTRRSASQSVRIRSDRRRSFSAGRARRFSRRNVDSAVFPAGALMN